IGIMTLFALVTQAAEGRERAASSTVTVCIQKGANIQSLPAEGVASAIFAGIGVKLDWRHGGVCPADAIVIALTVNTPPSLLPGTMAHAFPYEGSHIRFFYDRISDPKYFQKSFAHKVLGHVMAHEIAHWIQGIARHSPTGVLKAHWTGAD